MEIKKSKNADSFIHLNTRLVIVFSPFIAIWTQRVLEYWVSCFNGKETEIGYWWSFLITLIFNSHILQFNILSEIVRMIFLY